MKRKHISNSFFNIFCAMTLSLTLFTGCFGDDDKTDTPVTPPGDTTAPTVSSTLPVDSAASTGISRSTTISVTFSEAMDTSSITGNATDTTCSGTIQLFDVNNPGNSDPNNPTLCVKFISNTPTTGDNTTFTLTPASQLGDFVNYKIIVTTDAKDASGNALGSKYLSTNGFTTGGTK